MHSTAVLIVAGGTGGHISPGLALYEQLRESGARPLFLSGNRDARFSSLKDVAPGDLYLYPAPSFSKNPLRLSAFPFKFAFAVLQAKRLMKKNMVRALIGMGGYVSAPALVAASMLDISAYLCEQNSVPGKVTRFFEKRARKIYGTFKTAEDYLVFPDKYVHAGNPIRKRVLTDDRKEQARKAFNLGHAKKVILVVGGSQGARSINELVSGMKKRYPDELKNMGIIWSTGDLTYQKYKDEMQAENAGGSVYLSPFIDKVGLAYRAADIAISRSGAGVMMELAAMGLPSIQIPYPYAADNHQDKNADEFVRAGAAVKVGDEEATPDKIMSLLLDLIHNERALKRMSEKALAAAKPDASRFIVEDILADISI
jgi:UDP-N-acetylglucosamine--N-acetylmuramyl-(pentapeptide) pyrophosphoryl-undecaprenol N-acetylglucosamine transferase